MRTIAAPVNPADLNQIEGKYPVKFPLPATPGFEGVGVVEEVGTNVSGLRVGEHVVLPHNYGSWRERAVLAGADLVRVPEGIDPVQASMLKINPFTAWRLLHGYVSLQQGDWLIQNAANSGAGRAVIQIARARGFRTFNVVRRPELLEELQAEGGDLVLLDDENLRETVKGMEIRLALNAVGGESALRLMNCLTPGGTLVTYGAMSLQPLKVPNGLLIFKDLRLRGIWINKWYEAAAATERAEIWAALFNLAREEKLKTKVAASFPFAEIREAVQQAATARRAGKIVLTFG